MDDLMPVMSGPALARELRKIYGDSIGLIGATVNQPNNSEWCVDGHYIVDTVLTRPFSFSAVKIAIDSVWSTLSGKRHLHQLIRLLQGAIVSPIESPTYDLQYNANSFILTISAKIKPNGIPSLRELCITHIIQNLNITTNLKCLPIDLQELLIEQFWNQALQLPRGFTVTQQHEGLVTAIQRASENLPGKLVGCTFMVFPAIHLYMA
jgi:hypothetical protein